MTKNPEVILADLMAQGLESKALLAAYAAEGAAGRIERKQLPRGQVHAGIVTFFVGEGKTEAEAGAIADRVVGNGPPDELIWV